MLEGHCKLTQDFNAGIPLRDKRGSGEDCCLIAIAQVTPQDIETATSQIDEEKGGEDCYLKDIAEHLKTSMQEHLHMTKKRVEKKTRPKEDRT